VGERFVLCGTVREESSIDTPDNHHVVEGATPRDSATENEPLPHPTLPRLRGGIKEGAVRVKSAVRAHRGSVTETAWQTNTGSKTEIGTATAEFAFKR